MQEVLLAFVLPTEVVGDARKLDATRELRAVQYTARPMGVAGDVTSLGAQRVQKDEQITALLMVVAGDVVMRVALELQEGNQDCAYAMVEGRDARRRIAQKAQKDSRGSASHMEVGVVASSLNAQKGHKEAQCFARHMVGENGAQLQGAPRVQKVAHPSARGMVEGKGVRSKVVVFAQRAFMEGPTSVWHMGVVRGVLSQNAQRAQGAELTIVYAMEGARDADSMAVARVHKVAQTSARHMVEGKDVLGVRLGRNSAVVAAAKMDLVVHSPGGRPGSVHRTMPLSKTSESMVVPPSEDIPPSRSPHLASLGRR